MNPDRVDEDAGPTEGPNPGRRVRGRRLGAAGALLVALAFSGLMTTTIVTVAIWPGEAKLTAPLFCDDQHPDPFVVSDTYSSGGETTTNFTLYCVGDRGQAVDVGFLGPFVVLTLAHMGLFLAVLVIPPWLGGTFRLGRSRQPTPPEDVVMPDILAEG